MQDRTGQPEDDKRCRRMIIKITATQQNGNNQSICIDFLTRLLFLPPFRMIVAAPTILLFIPHYFSTNTHASSCCPVRNNSSYSAASLSLLAGWRSPYHLQYNSSIHPSNSQLTSNHRTTKHWLAIHSFIL